MITPEEQEQLFKMDGGISLKQLREAIELFEGTSHLEAMRREWHEEYSTKKIEHMERVNRRTSEMTTSMLRLLSSEMQTEPFDGVTYILLVCSLIRCFGQITKSAQMKQGLAVQMLEEIKQMMLSTIPELLGEPRPPLKFNHSPPSLSK